jgi:predicted nucleic acid-binding Zn ribbon protein
MTQRRADAVRLGDILPRVVQEATTQRAAVHTLQQQWARAIGRTLAKHTKPVSLRRGVLYVRTNEPGASYTLSLEKPRLIGALKAVGLAVEEIVVVAGELAP